jgi:signal transduction histidine kinase
MNCVSFRAAFFRICAASCSIPVELHLADANWNLDRDVQINLFRIIQEALTNVRKHSKASQVDLVLDRDDATVVVKVIDDGRGFDAVNARANAQRDKKLGLASMEDRARALSGRLEIESSSAGTRISVKIPLVRDEAATHGADPRPHSR